MEIGTHVKVEHGFGEIVAIDLPECRESNQRYIVKIVTPLPKYKRFIKRFKDEKLCYFKHEVERI